MAFYGDSFIFDNISSKRFNLYITTPDSKSTINISNYESKLIKPNRRNRFYATKRIVSEPLTLNITLFSEIPLSRSEIDEIENWLFSDSDEFKELRINQEDMEDYYYNCRLQKLDSETIGNYPYTCNVIMETDSHYIYQNFQTRTFNIATTPFNLRFVNYSSENLMSPVYTIKANSTGGTIKIVNNNISGTKYNTMEFNNLLANEILTIDTENEIITSDKRTSGLLDLFTNINFMRLPKGQNNFVIENNISEFKINFQNKRKVGN